MNSPKKYIDFIWNNLKIGKGLKSSSLIENSCSVEVQKFACNNLGL